MNVMTWTTQNIGRIEKFIARDDHFNTWTVRKALDKEPGPWRIYVSGRYMGIAPNEQAGMAKAQSLAASQPDGQWAGR